MALFSKKKAIDDMTIEEIEKYLESKKATEKSETSLKGRVDESVAMQEKDDNDEDKQDAKARVDESLGEEKELEEKDDANDETNKNDHEEENDDEYWAKHDERMRQIAEEVYKKHSAKKEPKKVEDDKRSKLDKAMAMYN